YFALKQAGHTVHLANLSFANFYGMSGTALTPEMLEVRAGCGGSESYAPERILCEWFRTRGEEDVAVHAFHRTGAAPIRDAYAALAKELELDAVVLVDGGTDSLMRGDETGLGT